MPKKYTVCLCFGYEKCEAITSEIAKRNNAVDYIVEPVIARRDVIFGDTLGYRGKIIMEVYDVQ